MAVSISIVKAQAVERVNASTTAAAYGAVDTVANRFKDAEFDPAILSVDGAIIEAICGNPNHGRRKDFFATASGIATGTTLISRLGPIEIPVFVVTGGKYAGTVLAEESTPEQIMRDNRNPRALSTLRPKFALIGDTLFHNGAGLGLGGASSLSVNVTYCAYSRSSACQAPDEYTEAAICGTVADLLSRDGTKSDAARFWFRKYQQYLMQIKGGAAQLQEAA